MEDFEHAIQGVLNNPEMMEKIMGMAQTLGLGDPPPSGEGSDPEAPAPDPAMASKLSGLLGQSSIDSDQQNLLKALTPYMSGERISKLRRAMQAARLAELASSMMGSSILGGR